MRCGYMDRIIEYVLERDCGIRDFLRARYSGRRLHFLREEGCVLLNGEPAKISDRARAGDRLTLIFKETASFDYAPEDLGIVPVYEDEDVLVVIKPKGVPSMPAAPHFTGNLFCGLKFLYPDGVFRVVTRLDKDTSGLVLLAKNAAAHSFFYKNMREIEKTYIAVAEGELTAPLEIDAPIAADSGPKRYVAESGKPAKTHIIAAKPHSEGTLVTVKISTGRTHQIRVHLAHIGHPIVGDPLYGGGGEGQLLCCAGLSFAHPVTGEILDFTCDLPDYFGL